MSIESSILEINLKLVKDFKLYFDALENKYKSLIKSSIEDASGVHRFTFDLFPRDSEYIKDNIPKSLRAILEKSALSSIGFNLNIYTLPDEEKKHKPRFRRYCISFLVFPLVGNLIFIEHIESISTHYTTLSSTKVDEPVCKEFHMTSAGTAKDYIKDELEKWYFNNKDKVGSHFSK